MRPRSFRIAFRSFVRNRNRAFIMKNMLSLLRTLSVKQKMYGGFAAVVATVVIVGVLTVSQLLSIRATTDELVQQQQPVLMSTLRIGDGFHAALGSLGFYLLGDDVQDKDNYFRHLNALAATIDELETAHAIEIDASMRKQAANLRHNFEQLKTHQEEILRVAGDQQLNYPALRHAQENINPLSQRILQNLSIMIDSESQLEGGARIELLTRLHELRYTWSRVMSELRGFLGFRNEINMLELSSHMERFDKLQEEVNEQYADSLELEQEDAFAQLTLLTHDFREQFTKVKDLHSAERWRQDAFLYRTEGAQLIREVQNNIRAIEKHFRELSETQNVKLSTKTHTVIYTEVSLLIIALLVILLLATMLSRGILMPIKRTVENGIESINLSMAQLALDNDSKPFSLSRKDEIEDLSSTFTALADTLAAAVREQQRNMETLKQKVDRILAIVRMARSGDLRGHLEGFTGDDAIDELARGVEEMLLNLNLLVAQVQKAGVQVTSSTTDIAATAQQHEATVAEQAASITQIMATAAEISATSRELAKNMHEITTVAEATTESASDGHHALTSMEHTMHGMSEATGAITSKLAVLSEKAANINNVVTTITKVADQTNLLSLNAAIEAEKAGEYGLGFSVVATEIRRLADQTAVATWDIEQMVKEMQSAVSAGVMGMDKFSEEVNRGVSEVRQVGTQLAEIIEQVQALTPRFETTNQGMQSQAEGAEQISVSMVQLNESAQQTSDSLRQSNQAILQLKQSAHDLQEHISNLRIRGD